MREFSLKENLEAEVVKVQETLEALPWNDPVFYANWVAQTHYYCSHTTRLLALGAVRSALSQQALHNRFLQHAGEEKGHEKLCDLDLKSLGYKKEDFSELPGTAALYQTQYYWLEHQNPLSFFGYILGLEHLASKLGKITSEASTAHGSKSTHFLRVHAEEDIDHVEKAIQQVEQFPQEVQPLIVENMRQSLGHYARMAEECFKVSQQMRSKKTA